eukprot:TRINITY_DN1849_c0_g1_i1.p1 TRINITY_DN1849_c0_g1~~TRINITY_DN1849_c0_g1_i1.p1  ORF type:complete len:491 (+),score=95.22 TRINITY_DN1849_c0_g1_i1:217-1689(+)
MGIEEDATVANGVDSAPSPDPTRQPLIGAHSVPRSEFLRRQADHPPLPPEHHNHHKQSSSQSNVGGAGASSPNLSGQLDVTTRLLFFSSQGNVEGLKHLLSQGVNVNQTDYDGRTALHLACSEGRKDVVQFLLSQNANINPKDRFGNTPLSDARNYGHADIARILMSKGGVLGTGSGRPPSGKRGSGTMDVQTECQIDPSELDFSDTIILSTKGRYGVVNVANWRGTKVAVRTLPSFSQLAQQPQIEREFRDELAILQKLRHPNIVQFLGAVTHTHPMRIVTEYLTKDDLREILDRKGALNEYEAVRYALDIARGMNYLHQHKPQAIIHRNLKPSNLLRDEAGHLKVADFGLSQLLRVPENNSSMQRKIASSGELAILSENGRYLAPELQRSEAYDKSVDVYAFAVITYEMFEGKVLPEVDVMNGRALVPSFQRKGYPPSIQDLIVECLDPDPRQRPSFDKVVRHLEVILENMDMEEEKTEKQKCACVLQ